MKRGTSRGTEYPDPATPEAMALLNFSDIMDNKFPLGFFFFFFLLDLTALPVSFILHIKNNLLSSKHIAQLQFPSLILFCPPGVWFSKRGQNLEAKGC